MTCYCQWNYVTIPAKDDQPEHKAWNRVSLCTECMGDEMALDFQAEKEHAAKKRREARKAKKAAK